MADSPDNKSIPPKFTLLPADAWDTLGKTDAPIQPPVVAQTQAEVPMIPPITDVDILTHLQQRPDLHHVQEALMADISTSRGKKQQGARQKTSQELQQIAATATAIRDGKLQTPTLQDFFAAQKSPTPDTLIATATNALRFYIARELSPDGVIPRRGLSTKYRIGHQVNEIIENFAADSEKRLELLKESIQGLNRAEEVTLYHLLGTQRKFELDFPDTDICSEEQLSEYIEKVVYMVHGAEKTHGVVITPTGDQADKLDLLLNGIVDRCESAGSDGFLPIHLAKVMDIILAKQYGKFTIEGLLRIAFIKNNDLFPALRLLFSQDQRTSKIADAVQRVNRWLTDNEAIQYIMQEFGK